MFNDLKQGLHAAEQAQQIRAALPDGEFYRALQRNMAINLAIAKQAEERFKLLRAAGRI